ncbi:MAG TPA: triphosphoribosyl-dephospho-CoA synthase, partial [Candidatus Izemoplasmatales bacterium]|nr:triphosphoribosyl-dephospho-CoA synthase [Candidatus Izemoplasmatales bacterium]
KNLCMTFGQKAEKLYHMQGAKGQALSGYQDVIDVLKCHPSLDLHPMLVSLIMSIEDTNLLKRAGGMERYLKIKELFKNLNVKDDKAIQKLTDYCIDNHLTFGGSADLLIIALVIDSMVRKHEKINL